MGISPTFAILNRADSAPSRRPQGMRPRVSMLPEVPYGLALPSADSGLRGSWDGPPNTADQLQSGAPSDSPARAQAHLRLQYGCRAELRQLHPLARRRRCQMSDTCQPRSGPTHRPWRRTIGKVVAGVSFKMRLRGIGHW